MPDHAAIAATVLAALTDGERSRLASASRKAAYSAERDQDDDFLCALGNAGQWAPMEDGEPVTEAVLLWACERLALAKAARQTDERDWWRLLAGAFGRDQVERIGALYADVPLGADCLAQPAVPAP